MKLNKNLRKLIVSMILFFTAFGSISIVYAGGSGLATVIEHNLESIFKNFAQAIDKKYPDHAIQATLYTKVSKRITELAQEASGNKRLVLNYIGDLFYNKMIQLNDNNTEELITNIYITALDGSSIAQNLNTEKFGCDDKLFPIQQSTQLTPQEAIAALLNYQVETPRYTDYSETYNVLSESTLTIDSLTITNGLAKLELAGNLYVGGACDNPRVSAQINQTLLQYPEINDVEILINGEDINSFLSERDDEDENYNDDYIGGEFNYDLTDIAINGVGTEPFRSFSSNGNSLEWSQPGETDVETQQYNISATTSEQNIFIENDDYTLYIMLSETECINDMNGFSYDHYVYIEKDGITLEGCANMDYLEL